jgi:hypothetical protein
MGGGGRIPEWDLPFESQDPTPLVGGSQLAGGLTVMAGTVHGGPAGTAPCLVFRFHDQGLRAMDPPITLVLSAEGLESIGQTIAKAIAAAVAASRKAD